MKMEKERFYQFTIKGWEGPVYGVIVSIGVEWTLVKKIVGDFAYDGYALIHNKFIKRCIQDEKVIFKEKVLRAKGIMDLLIPVVPLGSQTEPLIWFNEQKLTVQINPKDESVCYVGEIISIMKTFFRLSPMNPRGYWESYEYRFSFGEIVMISIDTDYVNSLLIYNMKKKE